MKVSARNIPGFSEIPAFAHAAMDFFTFSALALDILGNFFTLTAACILFKTANEGNITYEAKFSVCGVVWRLGDDKCCDIPDDLRRLLYILDNALEAKRECIIAMSGGALFLVSFCILLITTQRVAVWFTVMVLMTVVPA